MRLRGFGLRDSGPASLDGHEAIRSLYSKFQRIQKLNTRILGLIAEMERALGGEYIFDRAFLESSIRTLSADTYQVVYSLNALADNRYIDLFDRFQTIKSILEDILNGGLGPFSGRMALPYSLLSYEMEPLAGTLNVCLAEARHHLDLSAPDGFAVTVTGCRRFFESNGLYAELKRREQGDIAELFAKAAMPENLALAIERESRAILERRGGDTRFSVRASAAGGYGLVQPDLKGLTEVPAEGLAASCSSALAEYVTALGKEERERIEELSVALSVHESIPLQVLGTISALGTAGSPTACLSVEAAPCKDPGRREYYWLKRVYPFDLLQSQIVPKDLGESRPGKAALSRNMEGLRNGSALVGPTFLKTLAQCAVSVERILGLPQEIRWGRSDAPLPLLLDVRPLCCHSEVDIPNDELTEALQRAEVLIRGGETAQSGVAAGRVVHLQRDTSPAHFPVGAIAVARHASPIFSPILRKAAALITEIGTPTSHLAMIARELRVPTIVGAAGALNLLPEGIEVTVDAGEVVAYRGTIEPLFSFRSSGTDLYPTDPEYMILRRLLRWVMPLNLVDPESRDFAPENCQTFHDVIHFAHERSVEALISIQEKTGGKTGFQTCRLGLDAPIEIHVLDVDRGLVPGSGPTIVPEQVESEPFLAFLKGLTFQAMWQHGPAAIGLRDILSGLDRTFSVLTNPPEYSGKNLAIIARHYMNISLRLGYHFSVIDSHLSENVNQNYVYFRFAGGFADEGRRRRRAELIQGILEELGFKVSIKSDLVVGKLKVADREEITQVLMRLGELTAFTRQLDVAMAGDETVADFAGLFRQMGERREHEEEERGA